MHHKRGRPKNRRSGCLMCKPHKMCGWKEGHDFSHSNQRKNFHAKKDVDQFIKGEV